MEDKEESAAQPATQVSLRIALIAALGDKKKCDRYSRQEAMLDLVSLAAANYISPTVYTQIRPPLDKGEFCGSLLELSKRWQWSRTQTRAFFGMLQEMGLARRYEHHQYTIFRIAGIS